MELLLLLHFVFTVLMSEAWSKVEHITIKLNEERNLTCGDSSWTNKTMYIIWKIFPKDRKPCVIRRNYETGDFMDDCQDHKVLRNNSKDQLILHIPNFSFSDVGNYTCDLAYKGGAHIFTYCVNIMAPPQASSWLERKGNRTVAICKAERASPAANISWTVSGNITMKPLIEADGLITVTSSVDVNTLEEAQNLSCIITHPYWDKPKVIVPNTDNSQTISQNRPAVYATIGVSVVFCLVLLFLGLRKVMHLRINQQISKSSPVDYIEEVEPYESYVQRVNSIYNSSRDLFG